MSAKIIHRGRGPEIEGSRITVYDIMDYSQQGWHRDRIAALFRLSSQDVQAALDYIAAHQDGVTAAYHKIRTRHERYPYAPEVKAKIAASRQRAQTWLSTFKASHTEKQQDAGTSSIDQ